MINVGLSFISIAGLAIAGFGIFMILQALQRNENVRSGVLLTVIGVVIAAVFLIIGSGLVQVEADEVAVVFNTVSGDLASDPLGPGLHVIIPGIQSATIYSVAQQEYTMSGLVGEGATRGDDAVIALTQDGQEIRIDITIIYRIRPSDADLVHQTWKDRYVNGLVRPSLRNQVRSALTSFRVEQIYGTEHSDLEQEIEDGMRELLDPAGFEITNVLIRNIAFSPEYVASIEQKQVAQQEAQEAEFRVVEKEQEAEQARALARGEADAARIRAEGETEALRLINEQLAQNPLLLQWRYVETLSDNVQIILLPSNSPFLFDLQTLTGDAVGTLSSSPVTSGDNGTSASGE